MKPRCLVTGASGTLGREMLRGLADRFEMIGLGYRHAGPGFMAGDIRDPAFVEDCLRRCAPDVVVHCAAYRDPDFCEENRAEAVRLNVEPARVLARALDPDARLVFIGSDYVFDGQRPPYSESAPRHPVNFYGETKILAEDAVLRRPNSLIVRIPVLVSAADRPGYLGQIVGLVRAGNTVGVDNLHVRFPTWTRDVVEAIGFLLEKKQAGIFHVSGPRGQTPYAWAVEIAARLGLGSSHLHPDCAANVRAASRPVNAMLCSDKIRALGFHRCTEVLDVLDLAQGVNRSLNGSRQRLD